MHSAGNPESLSNPIALIIYYLTAVQSTNPHIILNSRGECVGEFNYLRFDTQLKWGFENVLFLWLPSVVCKSKMVSRYWKHNPELHFYIKFCMSVFTWFGLLYLLIQPEFNFKYFFPLDLMRLCPENFDHWKVVHLSPKYSKSRISE